MLAPEVVYDASKQNKIKPEGVSAAFRGPNAALRLGMAVTLTDTAAMGERAATHIELNREGVARGGGSIRFKVLDWRRLNEWEGDEAFDLAHCPGI